MKSKLSEKYNNYFYVPPEAKMEISRRNVKICKVAVYLLLAVGLTALALEIYTRQVPKLVNIIYYSLFVVISLFFLLISRITRKKESYLRNQALIILTCSFVCCLMYFNIADEVSVNFVVGFYCAIVIMIITFELTPFFYTITIAIFFFESLILGWLTTDYEFNLYIDNGLFCLSLTFFAFYKRKLISVRELNKLEIEQKTKKLNDQNIELSHQNDSLLISKQYLEDTVFNQTHELRLQKERLIRIQNRTIIGLSNLVENRNEDTGDHVLRVRDYVELIAVKARQTGDYPELSEHVIKLYAKAAPLHDIGKIVVPDSVLKKPGKLTYEEFELIKLHTTKGGKIVEDVLGPEEDKDYVKIAKDIATSHHEKYDGSGYPYGLKGDEIPLPARIMSIAAVFDALVSPRVYKKTVSVEDAFRIIEQGAGTQFDPKLVKVFLESKDEVNGILLRYQHL